jgi:hypothetical protein
MSDGVGLLIVLFFVAIILDFILVSGWKKYRSLLQEQEKSETPVSKPQLLKQAFYGDELSRLTQPVRRVLANVHLRTGLRIVLELGLLALWAIIIGWNYLNMDPNVTPTGNEFGSNIQTNHLWTQVLKCGWCAVWNGFESGGYPAFADIQGSMLHPITMVTTLLWGVVNGVKITLVLSFWFAGLAQWWIARELNLGWVPRMWSAGIAMAGGHLAGRMDLGVSGVVLSTAMASLVLAAMIRLARTGRRKDAILLGILTASAIVSGQGYIQIGLIGILPVAVWFFVSKWDSFDEWKNYLLATGIALLLAAPLLIPFIHFSPNISKWMDPEFKSVQPLPYLVLNLVIDNPRYFFTTLLAKFPYPYLYTLYIGWIPVLLAVYALNKIKAEDRKFIWFMTIGVVIEFLIASGILLKALVKIWPALAGVRHPPQIAGLAIPLILGLSAYGLDQLLKAPWPKLSFKDAGGNGKKWSLSSQWLLIIPLIFSLQSCLHFAQYWIKTERVVNDAKKVLAYLETEDVQWVEAPYGEHLFIEPAISMGMKLSPGILTWGWRGRTPPRAAISAVREWTAVGDAKKINSLMGFNFYTRDNAPYAGVNTGDKIQPCKTSGSGGILQVTCNVEQAGKLVVQENMWTGWQAWMDGKRTQLSGKERLEVAMPAGEHKFVFRYMPWDVPLGLTLLIIGIIASIQLWTAAEGKNGRIKNELR